MALGTPTDLSTVTNTTNNTTIVSGSISPTGNGLLFACGSELNNVTTTVSTVTDTLTGTGTWTIYQFETSGGSPSRFLTVWFAWAVAGGSPGSGTVTVTFSGSTRAKSLTVGEITGQHATTPVAQNNSNSGTGSTLTVTLGATPDSTSTVIAVVADRRTATGISPGTGFTELNEAATANDNGHQVEYDAVSADTTADWTGLNSIINYGIAVEIAEAAAATGAIMNQMQNANLGADLYNGTLIG